MTAIQEKLFELQDTKFRDFQAGLCPTVEAGKMIGVRTPALRSFAKTLLKSKEADAFLDALPHEYFEENQLHGFMVSEIKDYDRAMARIQEFLPYMDNWATCDQVRPKVFKRYPGPLLSEVKKWIASSETYTIRFGLGMLMQHYLDQNFKPQYLELASSIRSDEYYVNMMLAWYFATALAKQYGDTIPYLTREKLSVWVHNKTIQKARESYRITDGQKAYLKTLKR